MPDALDILGRLGTELAKQLPDLTDDTDLTLPEVRGRVLVEQVHLRTVVQVEHHINSGSPQAAGHVLAHYIDILREGVGELAEVAGLVEELEGEVQALIMSAGEADQQPEPSDPIAILESYIASGDHKTETRTKALNSAAARLSSMSRPLIGDRRMQLIRRLDDVFSVPVSDLPPVTEMLNLFAARRDCYKPLGLLEIK